MKLLFRTFLVAAAMVLGTSAAFANPVTMELHNVGPGYNDNLYYVYPYNFYINGSSVLTSLMCDDFNHEINFNETWLANVYTMHDILLGAGQMNPSGGLAADGDRNRAYEEAAWLFQQLGANPSSATAVAINHTVWGLFTSTTFNSDSTVLNWYNSAAAATAGLTNAQAETMFSNIVFYTPILGTAVPNTYGPPQEMIGLTPVPEPATLFLLGSGLLGLLAFKRNKSGLA